MTHHRRKGEAMELRQVAHAEKRFTDFRDAFWAQVYSTPMMRKCAVANGVLDRTDVQRSIKLAQNQQCVWFLQQDEIQYAL